MASIFQGSYYSREFVLVLSIDHITGATGKVPTLLISKAGGPLTTPQGVVTEIGNGRYAVAYTPQDTSTIGDLGLNVLCAGCDPLDITDQVVAAPLTSGTGAGPGAQTLPAVGRIVTQDQIYNLFGWANNSWPGSTDSPSGADAALIQMLWPMAERLLQKYLGFNVAYANYDEFYPDRGLYQPLDQLVEGYEGASGRAVPIERYRVDNRVLPLRNLPVRSVSAVWEFPDAWDTFPPQWPAAPNLLQGQDYIVDFRQALTVGDPTGFGDFSYTGFLFRRSGVWTNWERGIRVQYAAGWTPAELSGPFSEFPQAVLVTIMKWFNEIQMHRGNSLTGGGAGAVTSEGLQGWQVAYDAVSQQANYGLFTELPLAAYRMVEDWTRMGKYL